MAAGLPSLNSELSPEPLWCEVYAKLHHFWVIDPPSDRAYRNLKHLQSVSVVPRPRRIPFTP